MMSIFFFTFLWPKEFIVVTDWSVIKMGLLVVWLLWSVFMRCQDATSHLFWMWRAGGFLLDWALARCERTREGIWENTQRSRWKKFPLLCTCQSVSGGLREHSVLPLWVCVCVCVCVSGGGGSLGWKRQQGCTVRTTKPQRHCYRASGEPAGPLCRYLCRARSEC